MNITEKSHSMSTRNSPLPWSMCIHRERAEEEEIWYSERTPMVRRVHYLSSVHDGCVQTEKE